MTSKQRQFHNFSPVFYNKEGQIVSYQERISTALTPVTTHYQAALKGQTKEIIVKFCKALIQEQKKLLEIDGMLVLEGFVEIIEKVSHDKNLMLLILPTLDGILFDERRCVKFLIKILDEEPKDKNILTALSNILVTPDYDQLVYEATSRVLSVLLSELTDKKVYKDKQIDFLKKLVFNESEDEKKKKYRISHYVYLGCLTNLLRVSYLVNVFLEIGGAQSLFTILCKYTNELQIMYYTLLCVWLLSYISEGVKVLTDPYMKFIQFITEVIQKLSREKIVRVAFAAFRNLCNASPEAIEIMVDVGIIKTIDTLLKGNIKDKDIIDDLEYVGQILEKNMKILSSFEKYVKEINSTQLDWSPVHSEKFWKENVKKFEENDFNLIRKLVDLLQSDHVKTVAVACYDLGEFCRFHPFGRNILEKMGGKDFIMNKARGENQQIREQALVALQKIMIHNWQAMGMNN